MNAVEKQILSEYEKGYNVEALSYQIMGKLLDEKYVKERFKMFDVERLYIYGGTYMGVQLYRAGKTYADILGIVDRSGKIISNDNIPVITLDEFRKDYTGGKVVITPLYYFQEIKEDLARVIDTKDILDIAELLMGIA